MATSFLFPTTITTALTNSVPQDAIVLPKAPKALVVQFNFTYGSSGTTVLAHLETSLDNGTTWIEIAEAAFTTASARKGYNLSALTPVTTVYDMTTALASNASKDGILGDQFRVKLTTTGTYAGSTTIAVSGNAQY